MNLKKNALFWTVILALVLVGTAALYFFTHRPTNVVAPIQASYTMDELRAAKDASKCWAAIGDGIYDLTPYVQSNAALLNLCGTDATQLVGQFGSATAEKFSQLRIGTLAK